ncbi:hypothetical protein [Granulicella sp. L60]|uniref:hypothetical protein n=1 Tax=Granulicella sp. L60 TaxID=1641866 RepID=UPI00131DD4BB|nr:hypothetical protein [Granulicella sp. L60]
MHEDTILDTNSPVQPSRRKTSDRKMERPSLKRSAFRTNRKSASIAEVPSVAEVEEQPALEVLFRDLLMKISSQSYTEEREFPEPWEDEKQNQSEEHFGNHFLWGAYQENTDLALAAECESENDINIDGPEPIFNLTRCPMYWKLRQQFVKDAASGDEHSFLYAIWRAYNAGRLSPDRLTPRTPAERREYRLSLHSIKRSSEIPISPETILH